jgi:hypothetical protein
MASEMQNRNRYMPTLCFHENTYPHHMYLTVRQPWIYHNSSSQWTILRTIYVIFPITTSRPSLEPT